MPVTITDFTPSRVRGFTPITVNGSGFSAVPGQNVVTVGGISATISVEGPASITFALPLVFAIGIIRNVHTPLQVQNLSTGEISTSRYLWIKDTVAGVAAYGLAIPAPIPGPLENTAEERPFFYEAVDFFHLNALVELLVKDPPVGQVLSSNGTGLRYPGGTPGGGGVLTADPAEDSGLRWAQQQDVTLPFGGQVPFFNTFLVAGGSQLDTITTNEDSHAISVDGTLDLGWLLWKGTGTLDRVRVRVNAVQVYDSGAGLAVPNLGVWSQALALPVVQGDLVQVLASPIGGTGQTVGGLRLAAA